jgi:protein-L-isoaspartate(D-aspartate) O-methyltransferase
LQAVGVDGRRVQQVDVSLWVRTSGVTAGQSIRQLPRLEITFFDEKRAPVGVRRLGPWHGDMEWGRKASTFKVPRRARLAVVMLGLFGAVGEAGFDDVAIEASD